MWELIRDGAILALCFAYAGVCLAVVAFWIWQTWTACRKRPCSSTFDPAAGVRATLVAAPISTGGNPKGA